MLNPQDGALSSQEVIELLLLCFCSSISAGDYTEDEPSTRYFSAHSCPGLHAQTALLYLSNGKTRGIATGDKTLKVIVTGASRGLGAAMVRALVAEGANVVAAARSADALEALAAEAPDKIHAVACDMRDRDAVAALVPTTVGRLISRPVS